MSRQLSGYTTHPMIQREPADSILFIHSPYMNIPTCECLHRLSDRWLFGDSSHALSSDMPGVLKDAAIGHRNISPMLDPRTMIRGEQR